MVRIWIKLLAGVSLFSKRIVIIVAVAVFGSGAWFGVRVLMRARNAIADGRRTAAQLGSRAVSVSVLSAAATRFEPVVTSMEFEAAASFGNDFYVCGAAGLFRYSEGELEQAWRVGRELPPARIIGMAARTGVENPELWIATSGAGIVLFNGTSFRQMLPEDPALRKLSALLPMANGRVLVGTASGLYVSDGKDLRVFHAQFAKAEVTALAGDEDELWIGTRRDGVWLWRGGEARHFTTELADTQVTSLAADGESAWVGTPLGVTEFKGGRLSRRLAEGTFAQALAESEGQLWIGTVDQGAFAVPLAVARPRPHRSSNDGVVEGSVVAFARVGQTLVAVQPDGLTELLGGRSVLAATAERAASGHITALHEDSRGRLWIGYFDRGVDLIPATGSSARAHLEDDTLFCINRIKENPQDGSVMIGTANGLAIFDAGGKMRQVMTRESGLIAGNITDLLYQDDLITVATPAGLSFVEHGSVASIYAFHGLVNNHVYTLASLNGTIYAGTLGGVSAVRRGVVQASFNTANSALRQNWITASAVFRGRLYLGTYGSGVIGFDGQGGVESFPSFSGQRYEINLNALVATDRALYAGTAGQGLAVLRTGGRRWEFVTEGLPSLNVTALEANGGRLYVGTDNGLARISENELVP